MRCARWYGPREVPWYRLVEAAPSQAGNDLFFCSAATIVLWFVRFY
jgi:hypothetical protein